MQHNAQHQGDKHFIPPMLSSTPDLVALPETMTKKLQKKRKKDDGSYYFFIIYISLKIPWANENLNSLDSDLK